LYPSDIGYVKTKKTGAPTGFKLTNSKVTNSKNDI
jgi:hypothetical protein